MQEVAAGLTVPVTMVMHGLDSGSFFENNLWNVARQINGVSLNRIRLDEKCESPGPFLPYLALLNDDLETIFYHAAPEGSEFQPFLNVVKWLGSTGKSLSGDGEQPDGTQRSDPLELLIFIAPTCPHCPVMVRTCVMIAANDPRLRLRVIDALHFRDWAERYKVKSAPTVVIDDGLTLVGNIDSQELTSGILSIRDPSFITKILESMMNTGRAEDAGMWICKNKAAKAVLPLYCSPVFSQRMGALVAMEEALSQDPRILDEIVDDLILLLSHEDDGLRGDTSELLGKVCLPKAIPHLERLRDDPNEDVRDAAIEALGVLEKST